MTPWQRRLADAERRRLRQREYAQRPEVKAHRREYMLSWWAEHREEWVEYKRDWQRTKRAQSK